jgi:O-antigen/teichoic acid export membrane protein
MADEQRITKQVSFYVSSRYLSYFFTALSGILIARFLGPALFGIFSALMIIVNYSRFSHLGVMHAVQKKIPLLRMKHPEKVSQLRAQGISSAMSIVIFSAIIILIVSFFLDFDVVTLNALRMVAVVVIAQQFFLFYEMFLRVDKKFELLSRVNIFYSILRFLFVLILVLRFKLIGTFFAIFLSYFLINLYLLAKQKYSLNFNFNFKKTFSLVKYGIPLLLIGLMFILFSSIDKLMIIKFLDKTALGYYSLPLLIAELLFYFPQTIAYVLFPDLLERVGKSKTSVIEDNLENNENKEISGNKQINKNKDNKEEIKAFLFAPLLVLAFLMPIVIGLTYITAPFFIQLILPEYIPGIPVLFVIVPAIFFMGFSSICGIFLIGLNKEKVYLTHQVIMISLAILLNYVALSNGYGIVGVAVATAISFFLYSTIMLYLSLKNYVSGFVGLLKKYIHLYSPIVYVMIILKLFALFEFQNVWYELINIIAKSFLFILLVLPFVYYVNKKVGVISQIISFIGQFPLIGKIVIIGAKWLKLI